MSEVASAYVTLVPSFRGGTGAIVSALGDAPAQAGDEGGRSFASRFMSGVGGVVGGVAKIGVATAGAIVTAGGASLGALLRVGVGYNNLEQSSRAAFTTLLGTADAADTMMAQLREFGKSSPFPRQAFIEGTQQLLGFGVSAQQVIPTLSAIQDAVAATGGGADQIAQITYALAQVKGQGKLTGETLNQLGQFGINAADILAQQFGTTSDAIRDMASKPGGIPADKVFDPLVAGLESKFGGAAANVKNTFAGATDRIKGAFRDLGSSIAEPFVSKKGGGLAVDLLNRIATNIRGLIPLADAIAAKLTTAFANPAVGGFLDRIDAGIASLTARAMTFVQNGGIERWVANAQTAADQAVVVFGRIRDGIVGVYQLVVNGDFTGQFARAFGVDEDSAVVDRLLSIRDAVIGIFSSFRGADTSPMDHLATAAATTKTGLDNVASSAGGLTGAVSGLGTALGNAANGGGVILSNLLGIISGGLAFFADHTTLATAAILAMTASMVAQGPISEAYRLAYAIRTPLMVAQTIATGFQTAATKALTAALLQQAGAENASNATTSRGLVVKAASAARTAAVATATGLWKAAMVVANSVQERGILGTIRYGAVLVAQKVTQLAIAGATKAWAAAQWLLNAAMDANPIVLIGLAIVALVAIFVVAYNKSDTFRSIVQAAFRAIGAVASWLWDNVLKPVFGFIWSAIQVVGAVALWLWHNVMVPAFTVIGAYANIMWTILKVVFYAIELVIGLVIVAALWLWHNVMEPAFAAIAAVVLWAWTNVIQPTFALLVAAFSWIADGALWLWHNVIEPVWNGIRDAITAVVDWLAPRIQAVMDVVSAIWSAAWGAISGVVSAVWGAISGAVVAGWNGIVSFIGSVGGALSSAFHAVWDPIVEFIGGIWDGVVSGFKSALNGVISVLNSGINFINTKLIDTANKVPFINIPHIPQIPSLATGGIVPATPGGQIVRVAEAGEDEIVSPVSMLRSIVAEGQGRGDGPLVGVLHVEAADDPLTTAHVVTARLSRLKR